MLLRSLRIEGYEVRVRGRRRGGARRRHDVQPRSRRPRSRAPELRRRRRGQEAARERRRPDPDADRARRAGIARRGPRRRRRRLPREAVRAAGAAGAAALAAAPPSPRGAASLVCADLSLNPDTHEVARGERPVKLTQRRVELLEYLLRNERIVVPRQRLLEEVWGYDPVRHDEHDRGVRVESSAQARVRWRAAPAPHDPRRRVRAPRLT